MHCRLSAVRNNFWEDTGNRTRSAASALDWGFGETAGTYFRLVADRPANDNGEFSFTTVPVGDYKITINQSKFQTAEQSVTVVSGSSPILHFQLALAPVNQSIVVSGAAETANMDSVTPTTMVDREDIAQTPGADRTNSMAMITDYTPGAYMTHDMLHMRGGHQVDWLIDGVPVPNTNIATNLGPQIDPKDIDYLEIQRGSYDAEYGDRTYGVFNIVPRTGFERDNEVELVASFGIGTRPMTN